MSNEHITDEREACAVAAWSHYAETCRKQGLNPMHHGHWCSADAIRNRGDIQHVPAAQPVEEPLPLIWQETLEGRVEYILQDDANTRGTRIVDIAYFAFMSGATGKNKDDGGRCDWFNDTKPMVMEAIEQIRRDLKKAQKTTPQPVAVPDRVPMTEFQRGTAVIHHLGPEALAGGKLSLLDVFHIGITAAEAHHGITTPKADK